MQLRRLGNVVDVSAIGLGCMGAIPGTRSINRLVENTAVERIPITGERYPAAFAKMSGR
jgi:aryl-alcohol dehydrogenase-like predicted oxidoreductase